MFFHASFSLHGLGGEVLAEVSHDIERVVRRGSEDASSCLETQVCDKSVGNKKIKALSLPTSALYLTSVTIICTISEKVKRCVYELIPETSKNSSFYT